MLMTTMDYSCIFDLHFTHFYSLYDRHSYHPHHPLHPLSPAISTLFMTDGFPSRMVLTTGPVRLTAVSVTHAGPRPYKSRMFRGRATPENDNRCPLKMAPMIGF